MALGAVYVAASTEFPPRSGTLTLQTMGVASFRMFSQQGNRLRPDYYKD